jgi:hypothetical protein
VRPSRALLTAAALLTLSGWLVLAAGPASAAAPAVVHLGSCRAQGDYATCVASGSVNHPHSIHVYVSASPGQKIINGNWDVVCAKGTGAGSKSGTFKGWASDRRPLRRTVHMPYRRPDYCTVSADAQLSHGGHLHIWLTAQK